ncbi:super-infection exclusion protein B [Empedobacter brevis]|uniref:super-infection exclusion protein B n=1 Tax=Empedobacter brevis TaxID=247 RepID=UPI00289F0F63|nr:super-infection exclusion protein B [Empedobacter brevis]
METLLTKFFDLNKIPTKIIFLLALVTGLVMFLPDNILDVLYITEFKLEYGKYFGIIFIVSISFLTINILLWLIKKIRIIFLKRKHFKILMKNLEELSSSEQSVIREFYILNKPALELPYNDPIVRNLINKKIIIRISETGQVNLNNGILFPFKINDLIVNKITLELLGVDINETNENINAFFNNNRPDWINEINYLDKLFRNRY